ncbi:hypothetical protein SPFM20_00057 [Salmonella phage SPFM20]|nr:hypothetical protein SPFM20_00057 [Salmonella phage SPFM20]
MTISTCGHVQDFTNHDRTTIVRNALEAVTVTFVDFDFQNASNFEMHFCPLGDLTVIFRVDSHLALRQLAFFQWE